MNFHSLQIRTMDHVFGAAPDVRPSHLKHDESDQLGLKIARSLRAVGISSLLVAASVAVFSLALGPLLMLLALAAT